MYCKNYKQAISQAQANASYFGESYAVFFDTSGNARCERWSDCNPSPIRFGETTKITPEGEMTRWYADGSNWREIKK